MLMKSKPVIFTFLNQSTAALTAATTSGDGSFTRIKNSTIPTDSLPLKEGSSNALALAGSIVLLSYCAHQAVNFPFTTTCVLRMQFTPFFTAIVDGAIKALFT